MVMKNLESLERKHRELAAARPLPPEAVRNLNDWLRVELAYTSNAIEGNTLTRAETAIVLEKGLTISGKPLKDHLEATNHAAAYDWMMGLIAKKSKAVDEATVLEIHRLVVLGLQADAGAYRDVRVRIAGSNVIMPNAAKVPALMRVFGDWLSQRHKTHPALLAAEAHYRLVTIHPFTDGNGRTARLLMNLILLRHGYPPAIIRPADRLRYIRSLEQAQLGGSVDAFEDIIGEALERSLDLYLKAVRGDKTPVMLVPKRGALMTIGELAKQCGESVPTVRFWVKEGLVAVASKTDAGYQLFGPEMIARVQQIRAYQDQRLTIAEIRERL